MDLSIVIPVLNEEGNLERLQSEIAAAVAPLGRAYEVIYVDDGSTDRSFDILKGMAARASNVRVIRFRRNFGQTAALACGAETATGETVIFLDADGQNDPADIPKLLETLDDGYDVVSGWRFDRKDDRITRILPSTIANWVISRVTGVHLHDYGCTLKAYRREILKNVRLYGEMHRFIPVYAKLVGARITELKVNHRPRTAGVTKYGLSRTFKVILDLFTAKLMTSYITKPIHFFGGLGFGLCGLGILSAVETLIEKRLMGHYVHSNPFILLAIFLFQLGVLFILMGLIAELIIRTYHESTGKAVYFISDRINIQGHVD
ncbi:glycosyltransferase family 2 protein [bacterium]|nr:glycosyltransferase family 2 protein [bacterium]